MKYIETAKTILLFVLVGLSLFLTFSIWSYTPNYETIEQQTTVDVSIAEKRKVEEVIQPYKVIIQQDELKGTIHAERLRELTGDLMKWSVTELTQYTQAFEKEKLEKLLDRPGTIMVYYQGEVPFRAYENVIDVADPNVPESSFDRVVITREGKNNYLIYFINREHAYYYVATAHVPSVDQFERFLATWSEQLDPYEVIDNKSSSLVAVPSEEVSFETQTYYQEEINPTKFRDALFQDPNAVRRSQVNAQLEEYADDHALMTVDTELKMLKYVYPSAESQEIAIPSELLFNAIDFINEHGGWTDEYRYVYMDPLTRYIKFQLFVHGLPVYSDTPGVTEIIQYYGENHVFRYNRPYYSFDSTLLLEREEQTIMSGIDFMSVLKQDADVSYESIEDVSPGYVMVQDPEQRLFILEPSWFYMIGHQWYHYDGMKGGSEGGLE